MKPLTEGLARWIWFQILKGSRKRRNQLRIRRFFERIPESARGRVRKQITRQERFARRIAVPLLKWTLTLAWFCLLLALVIQTSTYLQENEILKSPFAPK